MCLLTHCLPLGSTHCGEAELSFEEFVAMLDQFSARAGGDCQSLACTILRGDAMAPVKPLPAHDSGASLQLAVEAICGQLGVHK